MTNPSPSTAFTNAKRPKSISWGLITIFLAWVFGVILVFYVVQKPFSMAGLQSLIIADQTPFTFSFTAIGRTLLDLATGLWLWSMNIGIGLWLTRWLGLTRSGPISPGEQFLLAGGLGFGAVGLVVFTLGFMGFIQPLTLLTIAIILSIVTLPRTFNYLRQARLPSSPFLLKLYLWLAIGMGLSIALLPATDWDGLFYHLTGPKLYLAAGRIQPGIDIPHLNFPSLFEMQFMLALAIRGAVVAKLLHFGFSVLLGTLVHQIARRYLHFKSGWWAVILLFSMPMILTLAGWAYNDLALAFYQVGALYWVLGYLVETTSIGKSRTLPPPQPSPLQGEGVAPLPLAGRGAGGEGASHSVKPGSLFPTPSIHLLLSGLFCGLAMSLKYTSFIAPVTIVLLLIWHHWRQRTSIYTTIKSILVFSISALLIASPWYIKNWLFTGNPIYPFVFDGLLWNEFRATAYSGAGTGVGFDIWAWLTLPYQLTLGIRDANYADGRTGPLFLAFLPLILIFGLTKTRRNAPTAFSVLLIFALAQYIFWMLGVIWSSALWQSRLLLPAFAALSPVLAWILHDLRRLNRPQFSLQRFLYLLIGLVLALGLVDQAMSDQARAGWFHYRPWQHLIGGETESAYLTRRLGLHYAAMAELNAELPDDAVTVFLWEPRSFYCQHDCRPDSILDTFGHMAYQVGSDADAIAQAWQAQGITHILVHRLGYEYLLADGQTPPPLRPNAAVLESLEANHFELVFDLAGGYQAYRLK